MLNLLSNNVLQTLKDLLTKLKTLLHKQSVVADELRKTQYRECFELFNKASKITRNIDSI